MSKKILILFVLFLLCSAVYAEKTKPVLAVLDFSVSGITETEMKSIITLLSSSLFDTEQYIVINIDDREAMLDEIEFSLSDASDQGSQIRMGKLLSAELIVTGSISKLDSKYVLTTKLQETESSKTISTAEGKYDTINSLINDIDSTALILSGLKKKELFTWSEARLIQKIAFPAAGVVVLAGGIFLSLGSSNYKTVTVDPAFANYDSAPYDADYDALYSEYQTVFSNYQSSMLLGVGCILAGTVLAGYGGFLIMEDFFRDKQSDGQPSLEPLMFEDKIGICLSFKY